MVRPGYVNEHICLGFSIGPKRHLQSPLGDIDNLSLLGKRTPSMANNVTLFNRAYQLVQNVHQKRRHVT
jgi:hypothetical protein